VSGDLDSVLGIYVVESNSDEPLWDRSPYIIQRSEVTTFRGEGQAAGLALQMLPKGTQMCAYLRKSPTDTLGDIVNLKNLFRKLTTITLIT